VYWLLHELRRSGRLARRSPSSTVGIVVTLALGTGLNFAVLAWISTDFYFPKPARVPLGHCTS